MAKLPSRESLGALPGARPRPRTASISVPSFPTGSVGAGISDLGRGIATIGLAAESVADHDRKQQAFDAEQRFQQFEWEQRQTLDQSMRSVQPGQARDFVDTANKTYTEGAKEFFKTVPEHLKADYEARLFKTERDLYGAATTFARTEQKRFSTESINEAVNTIYTARARTSLTGELDSVTADYDRLVDANPDLTPIEKDTLKRNGRRVIAMSHIDALPPGQARELLSIRPGDTSPEGLLRKFEGFKPNAYWDVNAYRAGYGSDTVTRADGTVEKVTKDTIVTREDAERDLARRSAEFAQRAEKQVGSDVWGALPPNVKSALTSVAYNYGSLPNSVARAVASGNVEAIADSVRSLSDNKSRRAQEAAVILGGAGVPSVLSALTDEDRVRIDSAMRTKAVRIAQERSEVFERQIIDASSGKATLPDRAAIERDPHLDEPRRNTLLRQHDAAAGDVAGMQNFMRRLNLAYEGQDSVFNPYDASEKKYADAAFAHLGGDATALQIVVGKTGIVPKSAATSMRANINSTDPGRVASSLTMAGNMLAANPNVFASVENRAEFENNAIAFRTYVDDYGMSAQEAAQKIIRERTPEYQAQVKARIKTEDVDAKIKKELSINDLSGSFDPSWGWMRNPVVEFSPAGRAQLYAQYAEVVKERYLETGDWGMAKKQAADQMKRTWGVTNVNGSAGILGGGVVMQYPPERAPAYAGIENISAMFALHAQETILAETGKAVERKSLRIAPIPGVTARQYKSGQAPQYVLSWQDENGNVQMLNPGKAFVVDPMALRQMQSAQRQAAFELALRAAERQTPLALEAP